MLRSKFGCAVEGEIDLSPIASCFPHNQGRRSAEKVLFLLSTLPDGNSDETVRLFPNAHIVGI